MIIDAIKRTAFFAGFGFAFSAAGGLRLPTFVYVTVIVTTIFVVNKAWPIPTDDNDEEKN
jgi:hypothetical protein